MLRLKPVAFGLALTCAGIASPALADLTAAEVWQKLESSLETYGRDVTSVQTPNADGLSVRDLEMTLPLDQGAATVTVSVPHIVLTEADADTVSISIPETMQMTVAGTSSFGAQQIAVFDMDYSDLGIDVNGSLDDLTMDLIAPSLRAVMTKLTIDGEVAPDAQADILLSDLSGSATIGTATSTVINKDLTIARMESNVTIPASIANSGFSIESDIENLGIDVSLNLPTGFNAEDASPLSAPGVELTSEMSFARGNTQYEVTQNGTTVSGALENENGSYTVEIADQTMTYGVSLENVQSAMSRPGMRQPVASSTQETAFRVTAPIALSDAPKDIGFALNLKELTFSEEFWAAVDPNAELPRDPANIDMSIAGKMTPQDLVSVQGGPSPFALLRNMNALDIEQFSIDAVGALVTAVGGFTFDKSDVATFNGIPKPLGEATFTIKGANGLLDNLVALGIMGGQDVAGARLMMSMFTVPGDGPDTLTSTIRVNEQGHVLANGMRIQ